VTCDCNSSYFIIRKDQIINSSIIEQVLDKFIKVLATKLALHMINVNINREDFRRFLRYTYIKKSKTTMSRLREDQRVFCFASAKVEEVDKYA
jgi:hypothetical protein